MTVWTLIICAGINWAGCSYYSRAEYPSWEDCDRSLKAIRVENFKGAELVAHCRLGKIESPK